MIGAAGVPGERDYTDDLRDSRGCLLEAGGQVEDALAEALEYLHGRFTLALSTDDIQEGVTAFFEKREPVWKGR